jgi:hypothetical protein
MEPRKKETMNASRFQAKTAKKTTETTAEVVEPTAENAISAMDLSEFGSDGLVLTSASGADDVSWSSEGDALWLWLRLLSGDLLFVRRKGNVCCISFFEVTWDPPLEGIWKEEARGVVNKINRKSFGSEQSRRDEVRSITMVVLSAVSQQ